MINGKSVLAIIPARGGSKGLPGKNIKELCGKPLIAWSIEQAQSCKDIDEIVVSTDDEEIAEVAKKYGAGVPFIRPAELANDTAKSIDVIFHTIEWLKKHKGYQTGYILLLQPTSPLRAEEDIENAILILKDKNARAVVSVCETDHHPWWSNILPEDGNMESFIRPEMMNKRRQELPVFYKLNGAIYLADTDYLYKYNGFFGPDTFAHKMPQSRSVDIDSDLDFSLAALLLREKMNDS
ncbi:MAG: acylneuraminate cytidylyltransferase family protein [Deltaproteobacteria bacterium]|nr:acylneuraminate cytidylyltransferase family protein [Deltaproteobacteria bacterium]